MAVKKVAQSAWRLKRSIHFPAILSLKCYCKSLVTRHIQKTKHEFIFFSASEIAVRSIGTWSWHFQRLTGTAGRSSAPQDLRARSATVFSNGKLLWCPSSKHHQNCIAKICRKANFGPFSYPSGRNDPISSTNKTLRQIFDWVKIGGVINTWLTWMCRWWTLNYQIRICMPN
jgi:hypothetical protein